VKVPSRVTSRPGRIVCPACGSGELRCRGAGLAGCDYCGCDLDKAVLRFIEQIIALPDAIGNHACECGHPEMRRLPNGVFHCPACGSEVLPLDDSREPTSEHRSQAYRCGWIDGRFGKSGCFTENLDLVRYSALADRLDYLRGHRAGCEARLAASNGRLPARALRGPESRSENNACKCDE
jgi:ribosomal protein L37AE/L43A